MKVKTLKTSKGQIQNGILSCGVFVKRYIGIFKSENLQGMADVKQWYTVVTGNPFVCQGEGDSPEYAIRDAIKRTEGTIKLMQAGIERLNKSLETDFPDDTIEVIATKYYTE